MLSLPAALVLVVAGARAQLLPANTYALPPQPLTYNQPLTLVPGIPYYQPLVYTASVETSGRDSHRI